MIQLLISVPNILSSVPITISRWMTKNLVSKKQYTGTELRYPQQDFSSSTEQTGLHDRYQRVMSLQHSNVYLNSSTLRNEQLFGRRSHPSAHVRSPASWKIVQTIPLENVFGNYIYEFQNLGDRAVGLQLVQVIATSPPTKHHVLSTCPSYQTSSTANDISFLAIQSMIGDKPILFHSLRQTADSYMAGEQIERTSVKWIIARKREYLDACKKVSELNNKLDQIEEMNQSLRNACQRFREEINELNEENEIVNDMMQCESTKLYHAVQENNSLRDTVEHLNQVFMVSKYTTGHATATNQAETSSCLTRQVDSSEVLPNRNDQNVEGSSNWHYYRRDTQTNLDQSQAHTYEISTNGMSFSLYGEGLSLQQEQELDL